MKKNPAFSGSKSVLADTNASLGWRGGWNQFWFAPRDPFGLHILRVLAGLLFLFWLLPFAGQVDAFYSLNGWFDEQAYREADKLLKEQGSSDRLGWSILFIAGKDSTTLQILYWSSLAVLLLFTLGVATRVTSVLTFIIVVSFTANPAIAYDADRLLPILAFYLMLAYVLLGQSWRGLSLAERLFGLRGVCLLSRAKREGEIGRDSVTANLVLRLFQVHFAFLIVMMGLDKLQVGDWWSGTAFWFWLYPPGTPLEAARAHRSTAESYLTIMSLAVYATLAWQIGFPLFAWRKGWRLVLFGGVAVGWVGLVAMCGLPLFGPILLLVALGYLTPEEWQRWFGFMGKLRLDALLPADKAVDVKKESGVATSASIP
jgi:hypothetical protein